MNTLEIHCPSCSKRLPVTDRFCAYCGSAVAHSLPLAWLLRLQSIPVRVYLLGGLGGFAGAFLGLILGLFVGEGLLGLLLGALALAGSIVGAESASGFITDRLNARRFGQAFGTLGGLLAAPGALLVAVAVALWQGQPVDLRGVLALTAGGLYLGLFCALAACAIGVMLGFQAGRYLANLGWTVGRRYGTTIGAAAAWVLAGGLGGLFAGDFAAEVIGANRLDAALLGIAIQLPFSLLLLPWARRLFLHARRWWIRLP